MKGQQVSEVGRKGQQVAVGGRKEQVAVGGRKGQQIAAVVGKDTLQWVILKNFVPEHIILMVQGWLTSNQRGKGVPRVCNYEQ